MVDAAVAVTRPDLAAVFAGEFEGGKAGGFGEVLGGDLIHGDAAVDVCAFGLFGVDASEVTGGGAGVVSPAVAKGIALLGGEAAQDGEVGTVALERSEGAGEDEVGVGFLGRPEGHDLAAGGIDDHEADGGRRGTHGFEQGEAESGTDAAEEVAAREGRGHGLAPSGRRC